MRAVLLGLLAVEGCGRTGLDPLVLPRAGQGGSSALPGPSGGTTQDGLPVLPPPTGGVAPNGTGGDTNTGVGGRVAGGEVDASYPGSGGAGGTPVEDDPTTLGDERPGFVECFPLVSRPRASLSICGPGDFCCEDRCQSVGYTCGRGYDCDGPEDCPTGMHCCRGTFATATCEAACTPAANEVIHLSCGPEPCSDIDRDGVPDYQDLCPIDSEDGRGPQAQDGCPDGDGDGVMDLDDKCPNAAEDDLPPNPRDGCPAGMWP